MSSNNCSQTFSELPPIGLCLHYRKMRCSFALSDISGSTCFSWKPFGRKTFYLQQFWSTQPLSCHLIDKSISMLTLTKWVLTRSCSACLILRLEPYYWGRPGSPFWSGRRLCRIDLLIKVACFVKEVKIYFNIKAADLSLLVQGGQSYWFFPFNRNSLSRYMALLAKIRLGW